MDAEKVRLFMELAGQKLGVNPAQATPELRALGARLLLSEVLEYVIDGLGIIPEINGQKITDADALNYKAGPVSPDPVEMLDGLSDVAYTMYWNSLAFGMPLEEAFDLVCDNNLEKFVKLETWAEGEGALPEDAWHCAKDVAWPSEVVKVEVIKLEAGFFAVGKDSGGKVRKPSHYQSVDLSGLVS